MIFKQSINGTINCCATAFFNCLFEFFCKFVRIFLINQLAPAFKVVFNPNLTTGNALLISDGLIFLESLLLLLLKQLLLVSRYGLH